MGLTAEKVAEQWKVSREDQDAFALHSNQRAVAAIASGQFRNEITPYMVRTHVPGEGGTVRVIESLCENDEGRAPTPCSNRSPGCARCSRHAVR